MGVLRRALAKILRGVATSLDGEEFIPEAFQRASTKAMNQYIGDTEGYILTLEAHLEPGVVERLRGQFPRRFDTRPLHAAGAWDRCMDPP